MPVSKYWYSLPQREDTPSPITMDDILDDIVNDHLFGFVKVDIHDPDEQIARFSEFPPIFKNVEIKLDDIGGHTRDFCEDIGRKIGVKRSLIFSMHAEGILILTPLLKKYIEMGLKVTRIELVIAYNGKRVFDWFMHEVCRDRRRADLGGVEFEMKGESSKLKCNCGYGRSLMDKSKHTRLSFAKEKNLPNHVNNPFLKKYDELNEYIFEVEKQQKKIVHDLTTQIGLAVYSYAELRMLAFWEFINTFLVNDMHQLMEMDRDSLYIAFPRGTIDECVKPVLRTKWASEKWKWFSSGNKNVNIVFEGKPISFAQWDKRQPGKFKAEYIGTGMSCLNSKVFRAWGGVDKEGKPATKTSCKGNQKKTKSVIKESLPRRSQHTKTSQC